MGSERRNISLNTSFAFVCLHKQAREEKMKELSNKQNILCEIRETTEKEKERKV